MPEEASKWTPWGVWTVTMMEIGRERFPDFETIGHALRGKDEVPVLVCIFLAEMIEKGRIRKIGKAKLRRLSDIAKVLRGDGSATEDDRLFLAECLYAGLFKYPAKGRPRSDILTEEVDAGYLLAVYEHEKELAEMGAVPAGVDRTDYYLPGGASDVATIRTADAAAEKGMVDKYGEALDFEAMKKRLKAARILLWGANHRKYKRLREPPGELG
jgi:hypothetical protein